MLPRACSQLRSLLDLGDCCHADCRKLIKFILPDRISFHPPRSKKNVPFAGIQMMEVMREIPWQFGVQKRAQWKRVVYRSTAPIVHQL